MGKDNERELDCKKKRNAVLLFEFFQLFVLVYCNLLGKTQSHQICLNISAFPIYEQNAIAIFDQKSYHSPPPPPWSLTTEKKASLAVVQVLYLCTGCSLNIMFFQRLQNVFRTRPLLLSPRCKCV